VRSPGAKPRVLFVGRARYRLPLSSSLARKWDALSAVLELRVLASGTGSDPRFVLVAPLPARLLDGPVFYKLLALRVARELRRFRPDVVVTQTAYEAAAVLLARAVVRSRARVVIEVHADWRASTRLYGSRLRPLLGRPGDAVARWALRRADAVRTLSPYTTGLVRELGVEPAAEFPAFMDLEVFTRTPAAPLPAHRQALFVGVLERYKNVDGLARAWRRAAPRVPEATLRLVGDGTLTDVAERLVAELPDHTSWDRHLATEEVASALDQSTVLVLPSRSEGLGRVVVEAFCRGRPVLASRVGGIPDLVEDGANGLLVEAEDDDALADALVRVLSERGLAGRLAFGARESAASWLATPEEYAERVRALVSAALGRAP
jgi:glycosyltransferase involved in cell wall biosynthesis